MDISQCFAIVIVCYAIGVLLATAIHNTKTPNSYTVQIWRFQVIFFVL